MARLRNTDADFLDGKMEQVFTKAIDVFSKVLDKMNKGELELTGSTLTAVVNFLEKNEALLPHIRQRQTIQEASKSYELPSFEDDEEPDPEIRKKQTLNRLIEIHGEKEGKRRFQHYKWDEDNDQYANLPNYDDDETFYKDLPTFADEVKY